MTIEDYQKAARRTQRGDLEQMERLYHSVFGLNAEAGEVAGLFQKYYQGHPLDKERIIKELGDCLWMISEACDSLGVSMGWVMEVNIMKLWERYPDGFSPEKSLHRKDEDI